MSAKAVLAKLADHDITVRRVGDQLRLDAPTGSLTPDLLTAVKSCKAELLKVLKSPGGPGAGSDDSVVAEPTLARITPVESIAQATRLGDYPKVDAEFDKFLAVAKPMAGGGLYDPIRGGLEMPSGYVVPHPSERLAGVPRGWSVDGWVRHLRYMGNACAALNPEKSSEYLSKAEQLEDCCNV